MTIKLQITVLLLLFSLLAIGNVVAAKTWEPGVVAGDNFTYEMYGVFISNRSNTTIVIPQFEYNNTQWVRINITRIEGSLIHQVYILHFNNQSETELDFQTDVDPANVNSGFSGSIRSNMCR